MDRPSTDGLVNPGEDLLNGIAELARHRGVRRGMALLVGALDGATVRAAPDAAPIILTRKTWLVQATASIDGPAVTLHGVISWDDQGLPRTAGGQIEAARSGGVRVQLLPAAVESARAVEPAPQVAVEPAPTPPKPQSARAARPRSAQLDLRDEVPPLTPETRGWGAAVAASKAERPPERAAPTPRSAPVEAPAAAPASAPASSGWGAAVAASRTPSRAASRGGQPSPDELGFEAAPTLMAGDVLHHPRFGRCVVSRMVDKSKVKLRRPTGGLFDLHLKVCTFVREPDEGGRRVFSVAIG